MTNTMQSRARREFILGRAFLATAIVLAALTAATGTDAAQPAAKKAANQAGDDWQDPTRPSPDWRKYMDLPLPIARYVVAENSGRFDSVADFFTPDATVHDEGRDYAGLAEIREWMTATHKKYGHRLEPLGTTERDGISAVKMRLVGNFPGSPVTVEFAFALAGGKIESLRVSS
jgi:hypothetical protein